MYACMNIILCVCVVLRKKLYKKYCMTVLTLTIVNREKKHIIDDTWKNEFLYIHIRIIRVCNYIVHRKGLLH